LLSGHPGLAQSVVVAGNDGAGQRKLVAYVVPVRGSGIDGPHAVSGAELRRYAAERVPESMVPAVFQVLERMPTTADGKVDRASLPAPAFVDERNRVPRDRTEQVLAKAFAEVLELDRVGVDDDFFDLGGNSLRAIRLAGLIRTELDVEVSIRKLFVARSVAGLSEMWEDMSRSGRPALRRRTHQGEVL
jgi:acyl carrier protein